MSLEGHDFMSLEGSDIMNLSLGALLFLLLSRGREVGGSAGTPPDAPRGLSPEFNCQLKAAPPPHV